MEAINYAYFVEKKSAAVDVIYEMAIRMFPPMRSMQEIDFGLWSSRMACGVLIAAVYQIKSGCDSDDNREMIWVRSIIDLAADAIESFSVAKGNN